MKRIWIFTTVILTVLLALYGCNVPQTMEASQNDERVSREESAFSAEDSSEEISFSESNTDEQSAPDDESSWEESTPEPPEQPSVSEQLSLFTEEAEAFLPLPIDEETKAALLHELEAVFAEKQYGERAENLIRSSMERIMENYTNFQFLFGFLQVPDAQTYLRNYYIMPLRTMVNSVVILENASNGSADDYNKIITICESDQPDRDAVVVVHELWHMAVSYEHRTIYSNTMEFSLNEGGACLVQLTLAGSKYYRWNSQVHTGGSGGVDLDNLDNCLYISHFGRWDYSEYFALWYRLFTLTDFDTMALYLKPKGDQLIRQALIEKYGKDGENFYDLLLQYDQKQFTNGAFPVVVAFESLYLRLLKSRLDEVDSPEEMMAFAQMYRVTRLALGSEYVCTYVIETEDRGSIGYTETLIHPELDYVGFDKAVAEAICRWGILNTGELTEEQEYALAYSFVAYPHNSGGEEYKKTFNAVQAEPLVFADCQYVATVYPDGTLKFDFYHPESYKYDPPREGQYFRSATRYYDPATNVCVNFSN